VLRARRTPPANYERLKIGRWKAKILNELAAISNRHWRGFVKAVYGEKVSLYCALQGVVCDEAALSL
jgi:hypothetical protein